MNWFLGVLLFSFMLMSLGSFDSVGKMKSYSKGMGSNWFLGVLLFSFMLMSLGSFHQTILF